jgi:phosphatidylinositol alpha-1,6-mannosyltransferase
MLTSRNGRQRSSVTKDETLVGLFPWLGPEVTGGAQESGRLAWTILSDAARQRNGRARLFCYTPNGHSNGSTFHADVTATSRQQAILAALSTRWQPDLIFTWHIDLLRLVPLFRAPSARVVLVLLGIESWRRADWLTELLLRRVNLFLSISDHTWQSFVALHPLLAHAPHRTVHLGLRTPIDPSPHPPDDPPVVLMISRLERTQDYKGHYEVIEAWSLIRARIPHAQLWIVGDGSLRNELEGLVERRGFKSSIHLWGWVPEEQKQELIARCRCFALPSRGEGFGLVYLEAMRMGRPCLVSTFDAGPEVVNPPEAGLAVDPTDSHALADALCRLLTPGQEWERWSENARRRYEQNFTEEHFRVRLLDAVLGGVPNSVA